MSPNRVPTSPKNQKVLLERYKFSTSNSLGQGAFAQLYKGLDLETIKPVAIKIFNTPESKQEQAGLQQMFTHSVDVQQSIKKSTAVDGGQWGRQNSWAVQTLADEALRNVAGDDSDARKTVETMELKECFLELLDYSKDALGRPAMDSSSELYFMVTELGEISLADFLSSRADSGESLSVEELRQLHWNLISIVCGLHAAGFVHMDIKPCNIMRVNGMWKLIDFDGAIKTHTCADLTQVMVTPTYAAPEVARKLLSAGARTMDVSRLMDVWSLGMCALECIFLQPILEGWYVEWEKECGDDTKFLKWLSDYEKPVMEGEMTDAMREIDPDMSDLLLMMLTKDPAHRSNIADCICHKWFHPIRERLWTSFQEAAYEEDLADVDMDVHKKPTTATIERRISVNGALVDSKTKSSACGVM